MQRLYVDIGKRWKVGLCNNKTKIYQTIKGLIILFIKLQFSIRCYQAFRPLHTSISKHLPQTQIIYLNLSLNPNNLVTCIIPNAFLSFSIWLMILDVYLQKSLHLIKSSLSLCTCQAWGPLVYSPKAFCHSHQYPNIVMGNEANVCTRKNS